MTVGGASPGAAMAGQAMASPSSKHGANLDRMTKTPSGTSTASERALFSRGSNGLSEKRTEYKNERPWINLFDGQLDPLVLVEGRVGTAKFHNFPQLGCGKSSQAVAVKLCAILRSSIFRGVGDSHIELNFPGLHAADFGSDSEADGNVQQL